jgi:hypothetical protein
MNIINQAFKDLYKQQINMILSSNGLTNQCTLYFNNGSTDYCNNCVYDNLSKISAGIYNGTGPQPFPDYTVCPICMGNGTKENNNKTKKITLAVIFDSKFFINLNKSIVNIPDGTIQTICHKNYINDIRSSSALSVDSVPNISYERIEDVNPAGLGDLDYIFTTWKRL